jgi:DNA-binding Lrp family transcriptional regulator
MDETDSRLVAALRRDARASLSALAAELGLSRATVRSRLKALVDGGTIVGFTVLTRGEAETAPVRGVILIAVEGRGADKITRALTALPAIVAVHTTNGRWDLVAEFGTETLSDLDELLRRIRLIDGVAASETSLYLATKRLTQRR